MRFSVIIPTYNRANLLREALASVFVQTFTDYEVIVVDDGSTDATANVISEFASRVQFIQQANQGPGAARNLGAAQARGEYLAFLDSDDAFFPWTLACYAELAAAFNRPAFIAGKPFRFSDPGELPGVVPEQLSSLKFSDYLASGDEWRWFGVSSFVVRADIFHAVGGFLSTSCNAEDADLALKLGVAGSFIQVTSPSTFGYRRHDQNLTRNIAKNCVGMWHLVRNERIGNYPGGQDRARERWRILTRHLRPWSLACLRARRCKDAWGLYLASFHWHVVLGRWKYLFGFPAKAALSCLSFS